MGGVPVSKLRQVARRSAGTQRRRRVAESELPPPRPLQVVTGRPRLLLLLLSVQVLRAARRARRRRAHSGKGPTSIMSCSCATRAEEALKHAPIYVAKTIKGALVAARVKSE